MRGLPISEYPEVAPPSVVVRAQYPGANPKVIAETVATPLEESINGVEGMLYMGSQATTDGVMTLTVTFKLGTDPDKAQQLVQNRVSQAEPRLPEEVRRLSVTTVKSAPDLTMVVHLVSPNNRYDIDYLRNYAVLNVKDRLARIGGVGQVQIFGGGDYSMRVWLDPQKVAQRGLSASGQTTLPVEIDGADILLLDDVLHTGRTIRAVLNELFDYGRPARVRLAVLVDRGGRQLPVAAEVAAARVTLPATQTLRLARGDDGAYSFSITPKE